VSISQQVPDYELDDVRIVTSTQELKPMFDSFRGTLLELLLERAASVQELASAVKRPKSTVAYHVDLLADAGVLKVVRTRMVRGREERFYGRTARIFYVGRITPEQTELIPNQMAEWAAEAAPAHADDNLRAIKRYAWIDDADADEFYRRALDLINEFAQLPRRKTGKAHAFMVALYPTEHPRLPEPEN
jgi:predicted transcriptional regulator